MIYETTLETVVPSKGVIIPFCKGGKVYARHREADAIKKFNKLVKDELIWTVPGDWDKDSSYLVEISVEYARPKSHTKKNGEPTKTYRKDKTTKPDIDHLIRSVLDACTGILWTDDSQVISVRAIKFYGDKNYLNLQVVTND